MHWNLSHHEPGTRLADILLLNLHYAARFRLLLRLLVVDRSVVLRVDAEEFQYIENI